jgi:hypothetical protein
MALAVAIILVFVVASVLAVPRGYIYHEYGRPAAGYGPAYDYPPPRSRPW